MLIHFNTRQLSILQLLLQQEEPISAQQAGYALGLSARSVRYNLNSLREWLEKYDIALENRPNWGLYIPVTKDQRTILLRMINSNFKHNIYLKQSNRCLWIEFELLNQGCPYKAANFQYMLGISHNTCAKDLQIIDKKLAEWGLTLKRTPGLGTMVCGSELKYRYRFISLIRSIIDENDLIELCLWDKVTIDDHYSEKGILKAKVFDTIRTWKLREAWRMLKQLASNLNFVFVDTELVRLTLYISLSYKRISASHTVELPLEKLVEVKEVQAYHELQSLLPFYSDIHSKIVSDSEIGQLAMEVSTGKRDAAAPDATYLGLNEMVPFAEEILQFASEEVGCNLVIPRVVKMLSQHMALSITRLKHELPLFNPILDDIVKNYSSTLEIVKRAVGDFPKLMEMNLPLSELGYIALYVEMAKHEAGITTPRRRKKVIVVCPTGGITVGMLLLRIKNELPQLDVIDVLSIRAFNTKTIGSDVDAVITTSPSLAHNKLKVICVSPLLEEEDVITITNQLNLGENNG